MRKASLYATLVAAVVAAATLAAAASAGPAPTKILQLGVAATDVDSTDPALAYGVLSWQIEYETCAKLVDYQDAGGRASSELSPEAAAGLPVISKDGKTYTFTIRSGIRFSDGAPLTAGSFKAAIDRDVNPKMNSPVVAFIGDVVGVNAVVAKKATSVSGVVASGNKLTIKLTAKDGGLLNKLSMPFFCAIDPAQTPIDSQGVRTLPGAGPYYIASRTVSKQIVLKRNPYYHGNRPARSEAIALTMNLDSQQTYLQVSNGTYAADPSGLDSPSAAQGLAKKYGVNKSRFFVHSTPETDYLAMNTARPTFASAAVRKAVNYAIDRPALLRVRGYQGGKATSAILPTSLAGGVTYPALYPLRGPNVAKAKQLAPTCGNVNLWYSTGPVGTPQSGIVSYDLSQMGCKVTLKPFVGYAIYSAAGVRGSAFDAAAAGWYQDYADGYDFFHILLDGRTLTPNNNNNLAYFSNTTIEKKIDAANEQVGPARAKAWGDLDIYTMKNFAPWAPMYNQNVRDFIGPKTGGYLWLAAWGSMDLGTLYIK